MLGNAWASSSLQVMEISESWKFRQIPANEWFSAQVPGCVHTDLLYNNKIEDPFFRTNEEKLQWIGEKDWEYCTSFKVQNDFLNNEKVEILFEGLDTYAEVFLNEKLILSADNMHRNWKVDVKGFLKEGDNKLRIYFHSVFKEGKKLLAGSPFPLFQFPNNDQADTMVSIFVRKAGYHFGWDWGPRFVTSGIWKPIKLIGWNKAKIEGIHYVTEKIEKKKAFLKAKFEIESTTNYNLTLELKNENFSIAKRNIDVKKGINSFAFDFEIENPRLWWTNGLGEAHLYKIESILYDNKLILDKNEQNIGVRTLKVITEKDSIGKSLYIELNGVPVFMKGANYIPSDNFTNSVSDSAYEYTIKAAADAHMNMLRLWGGGYFEKDIFYELCDKYGILIWHDMLFACGTYPGQEDFFRSVSHEISDNVKRIRNHPSIALWNGNNEVEVAYYNWGWKEKLSKDDQIRQENNMKKLFYEVIPAAIYSVDSSRYYHPGSPNTGYNNISAEMGDVHYWSVWHGKEPFESFNTYIGRFMSEYGFQSYPEFSSVKKFTLEEDWQLESKVMQAHQRCMADDRKDKGYGNRLIKHYMDQYYTTPKTFEDYLYVSQLVQSKGVGIAIEAHRRNMPKCMGTLYWQINDCWPVASWSSIDYYGQWKALHYANARKLYKELLISTILENGNYNVYVVSDRQKSINAELRLEVIDFSGRSIKTIKKVLNIPANSSSKMHSFIANELLIEIPDKSYSLIKATLLENETILAQDNFFFVAEKEMMLAKPEIKIEVNNVGDKATLILQSNTLVKDLFISLKEGRGLFSDNYFDLLPGETKIITIESCKRLEVNDIKLKSVYDTK